MTVDDVRQRTRVKFEQLLGPDEASWLMDRPPGGWSDLVTNQTLDLKVDALRAELHADLERLSASRRPEAARENVDHHDHARRGARARIHRGTPGLSPQRLVEPASLSSLQVGQTG